MFYTYYEQPNTRLLSCNTATYKNKEKRCCAVKKSQLTAINVVKHVKGA